MAEAFTLQNTKILVVDDNPVNLKVVKGMLAPFGARIYLVTSGADCLKLTEKHEFDIIFLDHMMPEMDGVETIHRLKEMPVAEGVRVIALTANSESGVREMFLSEGFDDYLAKPVDTDDLGNMLIKWMNPEKVMRA